MAKRLVVVMLFTACARAQSVQGSVFDASTGNSIAGVKVELLRSTTPFYETTTDGGGRFYFANIPENDYSIRYQSPGHWSTVGPTDYRPFRVAAGSPVKLEVRLMPCSRISGRVVDARGNSVANARLELTGTGMLANGRTYLRTSWGGGGGGQLSDAPLGMMHMGNTDARGKFEVQVMPGAYGLSVVPPPGLKPPGDALAWKRTYYPGTTAAEAASKIVVLPGSEVSDVELKLLAVPTHAVRGVVLNPDGTPAVGVAITHGDAPPFVTVKSKDDGTFEFPAAAEGEWRFLAEDQRGAVKLRATEWVEIQRHDLENVKLRLLPPLTLRGKVIMEAPKDGTTPRAGAVVLSIRGGRRSRDGDSGLVGGGLIGALINPDANGDFVVPDIYPGVYRMPPPLQPPPPPYYLDTARVGDADLTTQEVDISSDVSITVVYKTDGGSVTGKAENCASGGVLLIPGDPSLQKRGYSRSGPCDSSERYRVEAVRPGEYYALAFAGNGPVPPLDEALLKQAVKVTVRARTASTADVRATTRPVF